MIFGSDEAPQREGAVKRRKAAIARSSCSRSRWGRRRCGEVRFAAQSLEP